MNERYSATAKRIPQLEALGGTSDDTFRLFYLVFRVHHAFVPGKTMHLANDGTRGPPGLMLMKPVHFAGIARAFIHRRFPAVSNAFCPTAGDCRCSAAAQPRALPCRSTLHVSYLEIALLSGY
jgi:hypothetical protein